MKRTPLYAAHAKLGARLVPFAGFEMPLQYRGIKAEHAAVREGCGLFDVSHMGQLHLSGANACAALERLLSCAVQSLKPGRVRYGLLCNQSGGVVDDVTLYRESAEQFFLCVNAANIEKDFNWCKENTRDFAELQLQNRSEGTGLLALQGPKAAALLKPLCNAPQLPRRFNFARLNCAGVPALVSATGYTGAPGFELYCAAADCEALWRALLSAGAAPCGLGARDTLRLEAALPLYGHELTDQTSPLDAGLARFCKSGGGYIGYEAQQARAKNPPDEARVLAGFELTQPGVARAGCEVFAAADAQAPCGLCTSAGPSPTLGRAIGLAYVERAQARPGAPLYVQVRKRRLAARAVATPFVARARPL